MKEVSRLYCRLEEILTERGLKKSYVAKKVGISNSAMSNILKGGMPHLDTALRIARFLGLKIEDIWYLEEDENAKV